LKCIFAPSAEENPESARIFHKAFERQQKQKQLLQKQNKKHSKATHNQPKTTKGAWYFFLEKQQQ
jgi:putative IMPACT (imprinted ancient) family translation regulator